MKLYGGIETGGTKVVCVVGSGPDHIIELSQFPTTTPDETIGQAIAFFQRQSKLIQAVGIGSFGPVDLVTRSPTYGRITTTPKVGWQNVDIVGQVRSALKVPVSFDTDVNAAALGEHCWGAARDVDTFVYLTVGTGIGGGGMVQGKLLHGLSHPEMSHIRPPHDRQKDPFNGICPYHEDCLEGLASGPAIKARWGARGETLPDDHPAWSLEAHYLALGLASIIFILSPQRIILGGGVLKRSILMPMIRNGVQQLLNKYIQMPAILEGIDSYIVPPLLGDRAGVLGAIALAKGCIKG